MSRDNQFALLSTLTVSEYKQFRKALRVLTGSGVDLFSATEILLCAIETKRNSRRELLRVAAR